MTNGLTKFADRKAAGKALAHEISLRELADPVVLVLPRGGVPVGLEIAREIGAPLDLIMVRKLGAPGHAEFAIGAVVDGDQPEVVIDRQAARLTGASDSYISQKTEDALAEIARRRTAYGVERPLAINGRTAIVVDDGIATGSTVRAALKAVRKAHPKRILLAVPVAPPSAIAELEPLCDEIICLSQPRHFFAVGAHYVDFGQTSDAEVVRCIEAARELHPPDGA